MSYTVNKTLRGLKSIYMLWWPFLQPTKPWKEQFSDQMLWKYNIKGNRFRCQETMEPARRLAIIYRSIKVEAGHLGVME